MYRRGLLLHSLLRCEPWQDCYRTGHDHGDEGPGLVLPTHDARDRGPLVKPFAWLPHSCDWWVIGGDEEVGALMQDLGVFMAAVVRGEKNS